MRAAAEPQEEGVAIAVEMIHALRGMEGVAGIHLMPVMWESITPRIVHAAGLMPAEAASPAGSPCAGDENPIKP